MLFRSSYLAAIKACPRKAYYQYVLGLALSEKDINLTFGSLVHDAIDTFHKEANIQAGIDFIDSSPELQFHKNKNKMTAKILLAAYATRIREYEVEASEIPVTVNIGNHQAKLKLDGLAKKAGVRMILEHKTTVPSFLKTKPNDQFILYDIAGIIAYGDTDGLLLNSMDCATKDLKFVPVHYSEEERIQWMTETKVILDNFEKMLINQCFPQCPNSCIAYNRECEYMPLCQASPSSFAIIKERNYVINEEAKNLAW